MIRFLHIFKCKISKNGGMGCHRNERCILFDSNTNIQQTPLRSCLLMNDDYYFYKKRYPYLTFQ